MSKAIYKYSWDFRAGTLSGVFVAKESDMAIDEAEILRCNSSGLMIYNPKNASQMLKSMKNKNQTREQKILAREQYERREAQQ